VNFRNARAIDAVVEGCSVCESEQCDGTVGYGGSPDENGETTLDAFIMDGKTMNMGAVAALRNVKDAIAVARHVLENTKHSMLVGEQASDFAVQMGFKKESLTTPKSKDIYKKWRYLENCQPNYWVDVEPNPARSCGPYSPKDRNYIEYESYFDSHNHDTIGMIVIDKVGNIAAGTSTNGARHKIPGRVGDSPIVGAGGYADNEVGAAVATGDGDILMRFLPSFLSVEQLRHNMKPHEAGEFALRRIANYYPSFSGAVVVVDKNGNYGAACHGIEEFPYTLFNPQSNNVKVERVKCFKYP
jgi:N4-(beta-N-acetylglucosaminyl)-L-asparaginase